MKILYVLIVLIVLLSNNTIAQLSKGGLPFSNENLLKSGVGASIVDIAKPNIDSLINQIAYSKEKKDIAAVAVSVDVDVLERGTSWEYQGGKVYELAFHSPDASGLIVHFSDFCLPDGAKVFVYNDNTVLGAYTSDNNKSFGSLTLQEIGGNNATVQLYIPEGKESEVKLTIGNVGYGFNKSTTAGDGGPFLFGRSLPCNHATNSKMGTFHQKEKNAVALMVHLEFTLYVRYSAVLVNTYKQDGTPYFLTARHCFEKVFSDHEFHPEYAETAVAHFNYESLAPGENGEWNHTISGAEILCADPSDETFYYDAVLLKFSETPKEEFNPFYAGVNFEELKITDIQNYESSIKGNGSFSVIHHPAGDVKKISWYERVSGLGSVNGKFVSVTDNDGITEKGSSGSPLFDKDHYVIGVLSGGTGGESNVVCDVEFRDSYVMLENTKLYLPDLDNYLFGNSNTRKIEPYEPYGDDSRLIFLPNSIKIDHDKEMLVCVNKSTANYSNFRWDFGAGAEPQTFTGVEPPEIKLLELGYYKVTLTALNNNTGQDETFVADSIIQCRYGKAYPHFVLSDSPNGLESAISANLNDFQYDDTLYIYNNSYGEAEGYFYTVEVGENILHFETTQKEEVVTIPPLGKSVLETDSHEYFGRDFTVSLLQKHPEQDTNYIVTNKIHQPTIAAFDYKRINHFGREMPEDYWLVNETSFSADNKSSGSDIRCKWLVSGEVKNEGRVIDFSWLPSESGIYEIMLIVSNSFSSDTATIKIEYHLTVGVNDIDDSKLQVYPTLCRNQITIQTPLESMHLRVFDITGSLILEEELYAGQKTINTSFLKRGIYLFNFESNKRRRAIKIIKQ